MFFLVNNVDFLDAYSASRVILLSLILTVVLWFTSLAVFKNANKASLSTSIFLLFFYLYTPVSTFLYNVGIFDQPFGHQYIFFPIWAAALGSLIWVVGWKINTANELDIVFNFFSLVLFGILFIQTVQIRQQTSAYNSESLNVKSIKNELHVTPEAERRDIYYIILDAYSSNIVLQSEYEFDNWQFLDALRDRGFFIADCANSNYARTSYSLASSLNLDYIPPVGDQFIQGNQYWRAFQPYIRFNIVRSTLKDLGYKTVSFDTYLPWPNVPNSDIYISLRGKTEFSMARFVSFLKGGSNEYEQMVIDTTPLRLLNPIYRILSQEDSASREYSTEEMSKIWGTDNQVEQKNLYDYYIHNLNQLGSIATIPGNKFVYANFMTTHKPFLFSENGSFQPDQSNKGYINSIQFTNAMIIKSIDQILAQSKTKPIIIIQGDHSLLGSNQAFGILSAYYLPDGGNADLYPTISPVNTFRVIFNEYFGANLPLRPDQSFWMYEYSGKIIPDPRTVNCE